MKIAIGNDHAGTELKHKVIACLEQQGHEIINFGTDTTDSVDYPDYVHPLAKAVIAGEVELGILICGSGNGVCMTANKYKEIRAALCWLPELGSLARQHNNANVVCLPARFISEETAFEIVDNFITTCFEGGRHQSRVEKISNC